MEISRGREKSGTAEKQKKPEEKKIHRRLSLPAVLAGCAGMMAAAFLFYNRLIGLLPGLPVGWYIAVSVQKEIELRQRKQRREGFRQMLTSMETGLEAGYALENAMLLSIDEQIPLYRRGSTMDRLLREMRRQLQLRTPVWQLLQTFGEQAPLEEAEELAQVIRIQQRTGGNLIRTMQNTARKLQDSMALRQEIEAAIAAKRLEQRIMTLMPGLVLMYMRLVNAAYILPLYTTAAGFLVMTAALGLNVAGDAIGKKLVGEG